MRAKRHSRLTYSTEAKICRKCGRPSRDCQCSASGSRTSSDEAMPAKIVAKLRIEKSGRGGKTVTVIDGLPRNRSFIKTLSGELKKSCGTGGKAGEGQVEIQGDQRDAIRRLLQERGWTVKG